jgi:hypothetical protein
MGKCNHFPEKKDCLFFPGWRLGLSSLRRKLTQINLPMPECWPEAGRCGLKNEIIP